MTFVNEKVAILQVKPNYEKIIISIIQCTLYYCMCVKVFSKN